MHGESRPRQTFGKAVSRRKAEIQLSARKLLYPFGQLDGSYILALSVVGAPLGNEHRIPIFKLRKRGGALYRL